MTNGQMNKLENINNVNKKIKVLELVLSTMKDDSRAEILNTVVEELKAEVELVENEIEGLVHEVKRTAETEEEFYQNNVEYLMDRISLHEDAVHEILNKPERPHTHKFNHSTLMEYLKPLVRRRTGEDVNDVSVILYIEKLIADDLNKHNRESKVAK